MGRKRRQDLKSDSGGGFVKWCSVCREDHPASEFAKNSARASGLQVQCRRAASAGHARVADERNTKARAKRAVERALRPPPAPYLPPVEKSCTKCRAVKPIEHFSRHAQTRDGRNSWCKSCISAHTTARTKADRTKATEYKRLARRRAGIPERLPKPPKPGKPHDAHVAAHARHLKKIAGAARRTAEKREWMKANPGAKRAKKARRRAAKLQATPAWGNATAIREWYFAAKVAERDTGTAWHVDHIVPLNSPVVCGLHWEGNLQLLPGELNVKKSNTYWPNMPE